MEMTKYFANLEGLNPMKTILKAITVTGSILAVLFSGVATKYLPDELPSFTLNIFSSADIKTGLDQQNIKILVPTIKTPVLDGNLFIKKEFNRLVFGGVNFNDLKLSSRSSQGDTLEILEKGKNFVSFNIYDTPYIEIEYKQRLYVLEIYHEFLGGSDISIYYTLSQVKAITMNLKPAQSI